MAWSILIASAVLEAVWATALGRSEGFTQPLPTIVFVVALVASMIGLAKASERIPIGTAYAVWVGIGAVLTVGWATVTGEEPLSWGRAIFIAGIVVAVVGLKLVPVQRGDAGKDPGA